MVWFLVGLVVLIVVAKPLVAAYRASIPTVVEPWDVTARPTAFGDDLRAELELAGFGDAGAHLVDISGFEAVMHL